MIAANIPAIKKEIGEKIKLIVVSKFRTETEIMEAYETGQRAFAENRVQPLLERLHNLPSDIEWHLIGHLQSNKVKQIAPFINTIQSVDSVKLAEIISEEVVKNNRKINCLLQIKLTNEDTKSGFDYNELIQSIDSNALNLAGIIWTGVMGMAELDGNDATVTGQFRALKNHFDSLKSDYFSNNTEFKEISMGMSGDYKLAIAEGSTIVRIGSAIFQ
ncbi:MAG: YggS family pyridoxal phosphate-dependent enzyme [Bacteroidia bacterium]|nr:YggS family pyridoxal phosphate-dependent enzyme [Bacteroidia bacterium]